jgi:hypothetical protein
MLPSVQPNLAKQKGGRPAKRNMKQKKEEKEYSAYIEKKWLLEEARTESQGNREKTLQSMNKNNRLLIRKHEMCV